MQCGERTSIHIGDEDTSEACIAANQDICLDRGGKTHLDCRAFLMMSIQDKQINVNSNHSIPELQQIYAKVKDRAGCEDCEFYWWSAGYENAAEPSTLSGYDGWKEWQSRRIPCKSFTHYCRPEYTVLHEITADEPVYCIRTPTSNTKEDTPMQENTPTLATAAETVIAPGYQEAMELHYQILASGEAAAAALTSLFQNLKKMRDECLYIHFGVETFKEYLEEKLNIESRQAYTYINVLDNLQPYLLQSNAQLGITKLALLTQVPALERESFLEENDAEGVSVREFKEMVEKVKQQGEQLSLLQEENTQLQDAKRELDAISEQEDDLSQQLDEKDAELERVRKELEAALTRAAELEESQDDAEAQEIDMETMAAIREEARLAAEADAAEKIKAAEVKAREEKKAAQEKAQRATDKAVLAAKEEAARDAEQRFQANLAAIKDEKAQAMARAQELEKQLKIAGDNDTVRLSLLFEAFQGDYSKIAGFITETKASDTEKGTKFQGALVKALEKIRENAAAL